MSEIVDQNVKKAGLNRRAVVKGAAWSLPVIAAAIAAPAASASVTPASVTLGTVGSATLAGATSLNVQAPTAFDIQTGSAFTGSSVSYVVTIDCTQEKQKALIAITSASPGTGSSATSGNGKNTTFTGAVLTSAGNQAIHVAFAGFSYTGIVTKGTFTYTVTLTVTVQGSPAIVKTSTLTVTFP